MLWCRELSHLLQSQHSIWSSVQDLAGTLLLQLPANVPWKAANSDPADWVLPPTWEIGMKFQDPDFSLAHPWL